MAADILAGENPGCMSFIPFNIPVRQPAAWTVQKEIFAECQLHFFDLEADAGTGESGEIVAGEVLEAARGQMADVGGIGVGIVGAEMGGGDEHVAAVPADPMDLGHGAGHIVNVFDDMRHVDAIERVALDRPGKFVEIPDNVSAGSGRNIDADRARFGPAGATANIQGH